jgi:hypothetical protein
MDSLAGLQPGKIAARAKNRPIFTTIRPQLAHFLRNLCNGWAPLLSEVGALLPKWSFYEQKTWRPVGLHPHPH